jgi:putative MATE family efflux protein
MKKKIQAIWSDIREAIAGTDKDFTSIPMRKAIFLLAVPMVLETAMESLFSIADIFFVSRLGSDPVAVVGITESLMTLVYAVSIGLGTSATAVISRRIGEKNPGLAARSAGQAVITGAVISLVTGLPAIIFHKQLLVLMGLSQEVAAAYGSYTLIITGSNLVIMLLFINNAIFRSSGDAAISMKVLWVANILNIILDPILIFGWGPVPALGIEGAAIATTTGRGLGVAYQFFMLSKGKHRVSLSLKDLIPDWKIIRTLLRLSLGAAGQHLIATSSWIFMMRIVSHFGSAAVAGYTIALRIMFFSLMPSWGISNAAATLVGQNLGAQRPDRAQRAAWITGLVNIIFLGGIGLVLALIPGKFIGLFINDPEVFRYGAECLRVLSLGFTAYGLGMVMVNSLNGAGDTISPTWINVFCYWLIEVPLAYFLSITLDFREQGVFYSILVAEVLMTLSALVVFSRGKWKEQQV